MTKQKNNIDKTRMMGHFFNPKTRNLERYDTKQKNNWDCEKCNGKGTYMYDENHGTICDLCCKHDQGFWELKEHYGKDNGKMCCKAGCGFVKEKNNVEEYKEKLVREMK